MARQAIYRMHRPNQQDMGSPCCRGDLSKALYSAPHPTPERSSVDIGCAVLAHLYEYMAVASSYLPLSLQIPRHNPEIPVHSTLPTQPLSVIMPPRSTTPSSRHSGGGVRDGSIAGSVRTLASLPGPSLRGSAGALPRSRMPHPSMPPTPMFVQAQTSESARLSAEDRIRKMLDARAGRQQRSSSAVPARPPSSPARSASSAKIASGGAAARPPLPLVDPLPVMLRKVANKLRQ